jgi:hypothetical protein
MMWLVPFCNALCRPTFAEVTATLMQLIQQEQQRQAELEAFAQQQQQQQQQQHPDAVDEAPVYQRSAASNSSSSSASTGTPASTRRVRFSADADQICHLPNDLDDLDDLDDLSDLDAAGDGRTLDRAAAAGRQDISKGRAAAAAAVAAVLGVRRAGHESGSIDDCCRPAADAAAHAAGQLAPSQPAKQQQGTLQVDCKLAADQQQQQQQTAEEPAGSSNAAAASAQRQDVRQTAAAAPAPFSPFGNLKDQPWE